MNNAIILSYYCNITYIMMIIIKRNIGAKDLLLYASLLDSMFQLLSNNFINQRE